MDEIIKDKIINEKIRNAKVRDVYVDKVGIKYIGKAKIIAITKKEDKKVITLKMGNKKVKVSHSKIFFNTESEKELNRIAEIGKEIENVLYNSWDGLAIVGNRCYLSGWSEEKIENLFLEYENRAGEKRD